MGIYSYTKQNAASGLAICMSILIVKIVFALPLSMSQAFRFAVETLTHDIDNSISYAHLFIIQIYSLAENTSQISYCSNQVQGTFPLHLTTLNNIPILSAPS